MGHEILSVLVHDRGVGSGSGGWARAEIIQNYLDTIGSPAIISFIVNPSFTKAAQMNLYSFGEYCEKVELSEIGHVKPPGEYGYLPGGF